MVPDAGRFAGPRVPASFAYSAYAMQQQTVPARTDLPLDNALARRVVDDGVRRYIASRRARVAPFIDAHFSLTGALRLHRQALGWDILRAPVNLSLAAPQAGIRAVGTGARRLGAARLGGRLATVRLQRQTDVARKLAFHLHAELLQLPYDDGRHVFTRDALAETILADPRLTAALHARLAAIAEQGGDPAWRETFSHALAEYTGSRAAASEMTTALVSLSSGAIALNKLTPGALSLGPALAATLAQQAAVTSFPLGAGLGAWWYGMFPVAPPAALVAGLTSGLFLGAVLIASFAGIAADPVQRRLGLHRRRLNRMLDAMQRQLLQPDAPGFVAHDHYVARLLDLFDLLGAAYRIAVH